MNTANIPTQEKPSQYKQTSIALSEPMADDIILSMTEQGYSTYQIADHFHCNQATIWRRLQKLTNKNNDVKSFIDKRADILAFEQLKESDIQAKILDTLNDEDAIKSLSENGKRAWYHTLSISRNIKHGQERLERGQSTENISTIYQVIQDIKAGKVGGDNGNQALLAPEIVDITPLDTDNQDMGNEEGKV